MGISYQPRASRPAQKLYQSPAQHHDQFNEAQLDEQEEMRELDGDWEDTNMLDDANTDSVGPDTVSDASNIEYYLGASTTYGTGATFMTEFFSDKYADL